jgi:LemA protein
MMNEKPLRAIFRQTTLRIGGTIMLAFIIVLVVIIVLIVLWVISTQRKLVILDENISNAMSQIGVQLSSRFDALTALLELTKGYAKHESETLIETIKSRRSVITAQSTPDEVIRQENVITEALGRIAMVSEQYPDLKANQNYIKTMNAVETFENMVRTSRLIYNDSVTKLNREIRMFPVSLVAGMLGFHPREYLKDQPEKADMPSMK